jgi:glutathione peroxidase
MSDSKIYSFDVKNIDGKQTSLSQYQGKAMLIVNVASQCGFTSQYAGLEALYNKYHDKGFEVLGFPCNQFGSQEPGDEAEIKNFCELNYHVTFPLFAKIDVNGDDTHPLYKYLKSEEKGIFGTEAIKWNFTKFLIDREGKILKRFAPQTKPEDLESEVEAALKI